MTIELDEAFKSHQREDWLSLAERGLPDGQTVESLSTLTLDGRTIEALYSDRPSSATAPKRSPSPSSSEASDNANVWDNRVKIWACTPSLTNEAAITALEGGATSLELHLGEHTGWTASELPTALKGVYFDAAAISLRMPGTDTMAADALMDLWDSNGLSSKTAKGAFNVDPIGDYLRGSINSPFRLDSSLAKLTAFVEHTTSRFPNVPAVLIDGCCHHNAGATAVQELVAVLATASLYLEALKNSTLDAALVSKTIQVQLCADANTLMSVVKLRSLKMLWQHLLHELDLPNHALQLVAETSQRHLSAKDPWVNHLRNTAAVSAAAFANADTIIVHPHNVVEGKCLDDEALGLRIARNLPIVLSEESHLTDVQDPFAGSYAIEHLCQDLCHSVWSTLSEYKTADSWFDTVENGAWRDALYQSHLTRSNELASSKRVMVGVNRYTPEDSDPSSLPATISAEKGATLLPVRDAECYEEQR